MSKTSSTISVIFMWLGTIAASAPAANLDTLQFGREQSEREHALAVHRSDVVNGGLDLEKYRVVLGLDHWTLSKTPEDNARLLVDELRAFNADYLKRGSLDVITHSRGGLVARSFCELLGQADAVRNYLKRN